MNALFKKSLLPIVITVLLALLTYQQYNKSNAPNVTFTTIEGKKIPMSALKGKVVLVNFWATDCSICIKEMPELVNFYNLYKHKGFEVIAVAMPDDPPAQVLNYATIKMLPFPVMHDGLAEITKMFGDVDLTPTTFIFDKHGKLLQRTIGEINFIKLGQLLNTELSNGEVTK
ncbi:TlpA disulfide reductase family protein [Methylotenera sp.]|uniref:TlpA disulfide reductase family protein n=1 Tax=Methylotenera sp. TaxID=2051956 RepID=UPI0027239ED7|nr:TlpA disulfide reductase family protein [Methylotenera sp.]MDO9205712.1 TlpA disulfide reductase family protein [Methylotenera sp.]MDO9393907.1 TlpA disulfide reductase family protein [Methylotenera sp.]MDP1521552.1 TlpA disulfide reductase family protein [Methylotenera sp.]MDP2070057.1 TlpA disulfide reductase family protein [Methylotenera sp.]MDP2230019.1 TlpA disulfide reductase family protein [Methylotenera sp.]